jgi:hypothetical protein
LAHIDDAPPICRPTPSLQRDTRHGRAYESG